MTGPEISAEPGRARHGFGTTRWSLVAAVGDLRNPGSREALAELFKAYWHPLYAFARRSRLDARAAEDAVQGFFLRLLEGAEGEGLGLSRADRERGRFRSYLLGAFRHFLGDLRERESALKRGGAKPPVSIDAASFETVYRFDPQDDATPEAVYEKRWALTVLERALGRLRREYARLGKESVFEAFQDQLTGQTMRGDLAAAGAELGLSPGAARAAALRLRRRFAEVLRHEVAQTVVDPGDVDDELRHLLTALRG